MKYLILVVFSLILTSIGYSQSLPQGKWYSPSRNHISEYSFEDGALKVRTLNWNLSEQERKNADPAKIVKTTFANNNIYILTAYDTVFALNTIKIVEPDIRMMIVINGYNAPIKDTSEASEFIRKDLGSKYGLFAYSESEVKRMQAMRDLDKMTKEDSKLFIQNLKKVMEMLDGVAKRSRGSSKNLRLAYNLFRESLRQLKYNPLIPMESLDGLFDRLKSDTELGPLLEEAIAPPPAKE